VSVCGGGHTVTEANHYYCPVSGPSPDNCSNWNTKREKNPISQLLLRLPYTHKLESLIDISPTIREREREKRERIEISMWFGSCLSMFICVQMMMRKRIKNLKERKKKNEVQNDKQQTRNTHTKYH
jgi:hypothetical protein